MKKETEAGTLEFVQGKTAWTSPGDSGSALPSPGLFQEP